MAPFVGGGASRITAPFTQLQFRVGAAYGAGQSEIVVPLYEDIHEDNGLVRDIIARKSAEEAQARLAAIVALSADAIIGKTLDGRVTSWNELSRAGCTCRPELMIPIPTQAHLLPGRSSARSGRSAHNRAQPSHLRSEPPSLP
jgi:PAS domain-containing protein